MKATHLFLKKIGILSIATLLIAGCTSDPQKQDEPTPPSPEIPEESEEPEEPVDDLTAFFYKHMNGETALWSDSEPISADQIVAKREEVWNLWKKACESYNEEKLIALNPLGSNSTGRWKLPANLEPNATMPYYWGTKGTEPADGYPLFLYLHGSGDKDSEWITGLNICSGFDDAPSAYFIPQIPNTGNYYRWWQKAKQFAWEKLLRLAFASGKIDPDRVYFFGISEGGYGSQRLASFYADYLAGAGPMAGGEPLKNAPVENCRNIAFSLRTGANDNGFFRNTLTQYTKDEFDRLQSANPGSFEHNIQLIPGMGHGIDYSPTTPWLKNYTRDPYPKTVSWENFEMDGQRRQQPQLLRNVDNRQRHNTERTDRKIPDYGNQQRHRYEIRQNIHSCHKRQDNGISVARTRRHGTASDPHRKRQDRVQRQCRTRHQAPHQQLRHILRPRKALSCRHRGRLVCALNRHISFDSRRYM